MTTSEALLAAVLANPADDLPRLVYADYLEENMETERAEFIRVQVELFRIGYQPDGTVRTGCEDDDRRENHLRRRENQLHWLGWREWGKPVSQLVPDGGVIADRIRYRRGFVAEVRCTLSQWCGGECECVSRWELHRVPPGEVIEGHGCYACNGTGTRPGIGPAVVRSHPVEVVRLAGVVSQSGVSGSPFGAVTRESAGPLFAVAFPNAYGGLIEGELGVLNDRISEAALKWAKSQPHPTRITSTPVAVDVTG